MKLKDSERATALAAILTSGQSHKHTALRPKREWEGGTSPGIAVDPKAPDISKELDTAINAGMERFPDDDTWEVFGSNECFAPDDEEGYPPEFSMYADPVAYGEFGMYPA